MNIKEMEERSGLQRSNIRFYEKEGLLHPQRQENRYRDYSEEDLRQLLKIRLLRTVGLSLEELKALETGDLSLPEALDSYFPTLAQEEHALARRRELCQQLRQDNVQYATLDARPYLEGLFRDKASAPALPTQDTLRPLQAPWQRFFARGFDLFLYHGLWMLLFPLLCRTSPSSSLAQGWIAASPIIVFFLMLGLEPVMLHFWGTTPGKWLMGLSVRDCTGQKPSYMDSAYRTWMVLLYGLGLNIPFVRLYRLYKSYIQCSDNSCLPWEEDTVEQQKDKKPWRVAAVAGVAAVVAIVFFLASQFASLPPNRGQLTGAEFSENYNYVARYMGFTDRLDDKGHHRSEQDDGSVIIYVTDPPIDFVYEEHGGILTGVSFALERGDTSGKIFSDQSTQMALAIIAYTRGRSGLFDDDEVKEVVDFLVQHPIEPFTRTVNGVEIRCEIESAGYWAADGILIPQPDAPTHSFRLLFSMQEQ